jgi:Rps23 Pro-64 3,4-dihydroxylase Tpa1-like proline 4-hydroxylase
MTAISNETFHTGTTSPPEFLPAARLNDIAKRRAGEYASAQPYPHIVIDGLFDEWILNTVLAEFPDSKDRNWALRDIPEEIKLQSNDERDIPVFTRALLYALNSASFLMFLEELTGIKNLIGDPHYEGGGLHQILSGGKLAIHADFNMHLRYRLYRRLNVLIYLNKNWDEAYGGHFELWDRTMNKMEEKISPIFNRMVIFTTSRYSYHGHPEPLSCPANVSRKSLALYYFTVDEPADGDGSDRHTTLFQKRPGERFKLSGRQIARDLMPPLLLRAVSRLRGS